MVRRVGVIFGMWDLARYAADCRTPNGQTPDVRAVLDTLIKEYEAASIAPGQAEPDRAGQVHARRRFDDNDECTGCQAHISESCDPTCPYETANEPAAAQRG